MTTMTTHDDDALAEARAALPDLEAYVAHLAGVSMRNTSDLRIVDATRLLRALVEALDAVPEPPSRETGADGAKSAPGIPE